MAVSGLHRSSPAELAERLEAERREQPVLLLRDGAGRQRIVRLDDAGSSLTIGRQGSSDVALSWDPEVSRAHAALERIGDVWTVVDDGRSRNGSFVNGERVHGRQALRDGDVLLLGGTRLTFVAPLEHVDGSTAVAATRPAPALSPAQRRVLVGLCRPFASARYATPPSNRQLAEELCLSVETVKFHLHALFAVFGLERLPQRQKRAQLAQRALEDGVLPGPRMLVSGPAMVATGTYGPKGFAPDVTVPQGTYFVVADGAPLGFDDGHELCRRLPELAGVVAVPVSAFCREGSTAYARLRSSVRFTFVKREEVLREAAARLARLRA